METILCTASPSDLDVRLDIFLNDHCETITRSYAQKLIRDGLVQVSGRVIKKTGFRLQEGDRIEVRVPDPVSVDISPEKMDLNIVFEDDSLIVIDKPKGMVVHPAAGHHEHTLVNGLMYHCKGNLSAINGIERPGIVHRIDRDTTGLLVVAKTDAAHRLLASQFKEHSIGRRYQAITYHNFKEDDGVIDQAIARDRFNRKKMAVVDESQGRHAVTLYHVIDHLNHQFNHIECRLETGRTHQIRVHMAYIRHPLLGDSVYGPKPEQAFASLEGQTLHAGFLGFIHPDTGQYMEFQSELPPYFVGLLNRLKK